MATPDPLARPVLDFLVPAVILGLLSLLFMVFPIDLVVQGWFYSIEGGWFLKDADPLMLIYKKGLWPGLLVAASAVVVFLLGFRISSLQKYRKVAIYLLLVMVVAPGLLVNAVMKEGWGRPRPRQVDEFGGKERYERLWEYDASSYGKSFPSGHAAMGFYFFGLYFLLRREGRAAIGLWLGIAFGLGGLLGFTRMAQGGHFPSDVLWSAGVCYFVAAGLYYAMGLHRQLGYAGGKMSRGAVFGCLVVVLGILILAVGTPYHEEKRHEASAGDLAKAQRIELKLDLPRANLRVVSGHGLVVEAEAEGFGSPGSRLEDRFGVDYDEDQKQLDFRLKQSKSGFFATVEQPMTLTIPAGRALDADLVLEKGVLGIGLPSPTDGAQPVPAELFWDLELGEVDLSVHVPESLEIKVEVAAGIELEVDNRVPGLEWDAEKRRWKRGAEPSAKIRIKSHRAGRVQFLPAPGDPAEK